MAAVLPPAFTAAQQTAFFINGPQMTLSAVVRARLASKGLTVVTDFEDFREDQLDQAFKNMRTAIPGVPAVLRANGAVQVAAVPPITPVLVSARCALRLKVASIAFHYYKAIGRTPTPINMNYSSVLKEYYVEWQALKQLEDEDRPSVPILTKNQTPLKWMESFKDCLYRTFGVRSCPIAYVIREDVEVAEEADDPLEDGKSYGVSGLVLDEMIARLNHTDPLYKSDNNLVYSLLDEATRNTIYASTIKLYSRTKNGRDA